MSVLNKLLAITLVSLSPLAPAAEITNDQVFGFAAATYPDLFKGTFTAGVYLNYSYRFFPTTGNYLAVDTDGYISVLGPVSKGAILKVAPKASFEKAILAWEGSKATSTGGTITFSETIAGFTSLKATAASFLPQTAPGSYRATWGDPVATVQLVVGYKKQTNPLTGSGTVEFLEMAVAKASPLVSARISPQTGGLCVLSGDYPLATCSSLGISFDRPAGRISFTKVKFTSLIGTPAAFEVNGSLDFSAAGLP